MPVPETTQPHSEDPVRCWLVVMDFETGREVVRRGPIESEARLEEVRRELKEAWSEERYAIWVRPA